MVGNPEEDKLREVSRAYYLLGQNLRKLGRVEEANNALARSQQIRESKFKYDVKHIFDEKKSPADDRESRVSDRVSDLLAAGLPGGHPSRPDHIPESAPPPPEAKPQHAE